MSAGQPIVATTVRRDLVGALQMSGAQVNNRRSDQPKGQTMRTLGLTKRKLAAALAPIALAGGILAPVAAAAPAGSAQAAHHSNARAADFELTRGFDIWNRTNQPIRLANVSDPGALQGGGPATGSVLKPGDKQHFEVIYNVGQTDETGVTYQATDGSGDLFNATIGTGALNIPASICSTSPGHTCTPSPGQWTDWGQTITFLDTAK